MHRDVLIAWYFDLGYSYSLIVCFLYYIHGISLSLRQLKRILHNLGFTRKNTMTPAVRSHAIAVIKRELQTSSSLLGYRSLWRRLKLHHQLPVSREFVMKQLSLLSPTDVQNRKRHCLRRRIYDNKGPNYVWHVDGMDKLKPYGFPIHGCIDGYSRKVLWLHVGLTNNDPCIIAWHYLKCVEELKGLPRLLRTDLGTENSNLSFLQPFLRRLHSDCFADMESFRYGKSVTNQRIEAWWSILNKTSTRFWQSLFKELESSGLLNLTNIIHMDCLRFCFMHIIQEDLLHVALEWNTHRLRKNRASSSPSGHPDALFYMPQIYGAQNYLSNVNGSDLGQCWQYAESPGPPGSLEFLQMAQHVMTTHNLLFPTNIQQAIDLYVSMITILEEYV